MRSSSVTSHAQNAVCKLLLVVSPLVGEAELGCSVVFFFFLPSMLSYYYKNKTEINKNFNYISKKSLAQFIKESL